MRFPTTQFWSCSNQVTIRVSDWSNVPNRSLGDRVDVFAATVISSNLLFHCFVRGFIQHNGVCNVLIEIEIVANFRKARLRGNAINYFGFWITILARLQTVLQSCFSRIKSIFSALSLFKVSYL